MGKMKQTLKKVVRSNGLKYGLLFAGAVILSLICDDNSTKSEDEDTSNTYNNWLNDEEDDVDEDEDEEDDENEDGYWGTNID